MAEPLATAEELEAEHRPLSVAEKARAEKLLARASAIVRVEAGETWEDPTTAPEVAKGIALDATWRAFENPGGFLRERVGSYEYQVPAETAMTGVYLTDEERRILLMAVGKAPEPGTITTPAAYRMSECGDIYVADGGDGDLLCLLSEGDL